MANNDISEVRDVYNAGMSYDFECASAPIYEPLPGKDIEQSAAALLKAGSWDKWTDKLVDPFVKKLAGRMVMDGSGVNSRGASMYQELLADQFEKYLEHNPEVRRILDPLVVVMHMPPGPGLPQNYNAAIAAYPPAGSPHPALPAGLNGAPHVFMFPSGSSGHQNVQHFIGYMQHACPGLRSWVISANSTVIYW